MLADIDRNDISLWLSAVLISGSLHVLMIANLPLQSWLEDRRQIETEIVMDFLPVQATQSNQPSIVKAARQEAERLKPSDTSREIRPAQHASKQLKATPVDSTISPRPATAPKTTPTNSVQSLQPVTTQNPARKAPSSPAAMPAEALPNTSTIIAANEPAVTTPDAASNAQRASEVTPQTPSQVQTSQNNEIKRERSTLEVLRSITPTTQPTSIAPAITARGTAVSNEIQALTAPTSPPASSAVVKVETSPNTALPLDAAKAETPVRSRKIDLSNIPVATTIATQNTTAKRVAPASQAVARAARPARPASIDATNAPTRTTQTRVNSVPAVKSLKPRTSQLPTSQAHTPTSQAPTSRAPTSRAPTSRAPTSRAPTSRATIIRPNRTKERKVAQIKLPSPREEDVSGLPESHYGSVLKYVRGYDGGSCFMILPQIADKDSVKFTGFALSQDRVSEFRTAFSRDIKVNETTRTALISRQQCRALSFVRSISNYPNFNVSIKLLRNEIRSGNPLLGKVTNVGDRILHLILIDDEGLVQTIDPFLNRRDQDTIFSVPLTVTSDPVATVQLLIAIAVDGPLKTIKSHSGLTADIFYSALLEELGGLKGDTDIDVSPFFVR